jgi:methyl-accepting chemotaxis protein
MEAYRDARNDVLDMASLGNYIKAEEGMDDVTAIREIMFSYLDKLIADNESILEQENINMERFTRASQIFMYIVIGIGFVLAMIIGLQLSASISKSVNMA